MAKKCADKLLKLQQYIGFDRDDDYPQFLCHPFVSAAVFFETNVETLKEYRQGLDHVTALHQHDPMIPLMGCLVLRSQRNPEHPGYLRPMWSDQQIALPDAFEMSSPFTLTDGKHGFFGTHGWGVNFYGIFLFDFLASIRGTRTMKAASVFGLNFENTHGSRLFHAQQGT